MDINVPLKNLPLHQRSQGERETCLDSRECVDFAADFIKVCDDKKENTVPGRSSLHSESNWFKVSTKQIHITVCLHICACVSRVGICNGDENNTVVMCSEASGSQRVQGDFNG